MHQYRLHFTTRNDRLRSDGHPPFHFDVRLNGERTKVRTGSYAPPGKVHPDSGTISGMSAALAQTYSARLVALEVKAEKLITQALVNEMPLTRTPFITAMREDEVHRISFTEFFLPGN